nr:MAG: hypothetical protein [Bacteriophage sp.]
MGKSCLTKLSDNITVGCTIPLVGVKNLYLMHSDNVTFSVGANGVISGVTFVGAAKSYLIEGYKQNLQVTASTLSLDASLKLSVSVQFKIPSVSAGLMRSFLNGKFYVLVERNDGVHLFVGAQSPLECSAFDYDSNGNAGMAIITLSHPEGSAGNYLMGLDAGAIATIKSNQK